MALHLVLLHPTWLGLLTKDCKKESDLSEWSFGSNDERVHFKSLRWPGFDFYLNDSTFVNLYFGRAHLGTRRAALSDRGRRAPREEEEKEASAEQTLDFCHSGDSREPFVVECAEARDFESVGGLPIDRNDSVEHRRAVYCVISNTSISFTWKFGEPVKNLNLSSPVSLV
jgi:hypothetical protein